MWQDSIEHFCEGCHKLHCSSIWYYRSGIETGDREWMCGIKYLTLADFDMDRWRMSATAF